MIVFNLLFFRFIIKFGIFWREVGIVLVNLVLINFFCVVCFWVFVWMFLKFLVEWNLFLFFFWIMIFCWMFIYGWEKVIFFNCLGVGDMLEMIMLILLVFKVFNRVLKFSFLIFNLMFKLLVIFWVIEILKLIILFLLFIFVWNL